MFSAFEQKPHPSRSSSTHSAPGWNAIGALIAILTMLSVAACGQKIPTPEALARQVADYRTKGEETAAVVVVKAILVEKPDYAEARLVLGQLYNDLRDAQSAEKELRLARQLGLVAGGRVAAELGRSFIIAGQFKKLLAEVETNDVFETEAAATVLAYRGRAMLALQNRQEADRLLELALTLRPNLPAALIGQAWAKLTDGDRPSASALIDRGLALAPRDFELWMMKGDMHRGAGETNEAATAYGKAVAISPRNPLGRFSRGVMALSAGRIPEAQEDAGVLLRVAKNHALSHYLQALIHFQQGKFGPARDAAAQALSKAPEDPSLVLLAGATHYAVGSFMQTEQALKKFLSTYPNHLYARKLLAASLLEMNQGKRALEVISPALGQKLQDSTIMALAGNAQLRMGDYAQARDYMEKAANLAPKSAGLRIDLARARFAAGDIDRAIADLEEAAKIDPSQARPHLLLALNHLRDRRYDKALQAATLAQEKEPKNPAIRNLIGTAQLALGDRASARKSYEQALALDGKDLAAAVNLARMDMEDNHPQQARKRYEAILAADRDNPAALMALAKLSVLQGDAAEAVKLLDRAAKANPKLAEPRIQLAAFYVQMRMPEPALNHAIEARKLEPQNADALHMLGMAQLIAKDADAALKSFTRAVALAPRSHVLHYRVAMANAARGDDKGAEAYLNKALSLKPDYFDALRTQGHMNLRLKRIDEAQRIAARLKKDFAASDAGHLLEAEILFQQRKVDQALRVIQARFEQAPSADLAARIYTMMVQSGDWNAALARLKEWVGKTPADIRARELLADGYLQTGKATSAIEHLEYVVEKQPMNLVALNNLASTYQELKDPRALATAEKAFKLKPDNPMIADTLATVLLDRGESKRALELLTKAAKQAPETPVIQYHLALAMAQTGDKAGARVRLERLLASGRPFRESEQAKALLGRL